MTQNKTPETVAELLEALALHGLDLRVLGAATQTRPATPDQVEEEATWTSALQSAPVTAAERERNAARLAAIHAAYARGSSTQQDAAPDVPDAAEAAAMYEASLTAAIFGASVNAAVHEAEAEAVANTAMDEAIAAAMQDEAFTARLTAIHQDVANAMVADGAVQAPAATTNSDNTVTESHDGTGYVCRECGVYNNVRPRTEAFYVVTVGTRVGVIRTWVLTQPHVIGVRGAAYARYSDEASAHAVFEEALVAGKVKLVDVHGNVLLNLAPGDDL